MGADGGIRITKVSEIKKDWNRIRNVIIDTYKYYSENSEYSKVYYMDIYNKTNLLPNCINEISPENLIELLEPFMSCCDTPYLLDDQYIITSEGDNIDEAITCISQLLTGIYVETWT